MNSITRTALLLGALLAVVIGGSYFYSRTQQISGTGASAPGPERPAAEVFVGGEIGEELAAGLTALKDSRPEDARASLERVPLDDPGYLISLQALGQACAALGDFECARDALERLSAMRIDTTDTLRLLGYVQYQLGEYEAAEGSVLRALEIDDSVATLRYELALYRVAGSRLPEAIATYDRAIARDPAQTGLMTALEQLTELHVAHPELPTVHYALAYFGQRLSRPEFEATELEHFLAGASAGQAVEAATRRLAEIRDARPN